MRLDELKSYVQEMADLTDKCRKAADTLGVDSEGPGAHAARADAWELMVSLLTNLDTHRGANAAERALIAARRRLEIHEQILEWDRVRQGHIAEVERHLLEVFKAERGTTLEDAERKVKRIVERLA